MSLTEESIVNGIIDYNISYFITHFKKSRDEQFLRNYFNDYINGDLVDVNDVYNTILNNILKENKNDIFVEICDYWLEDEIYINFFENFSVYLQSQTITYNYKYNLITLFLNRPKLNTLLPKIELKMSLNIIISTTSICNPKSNSFFLTAVVVFSK